MASKPLVDQFNRHLRKESKDLSSLKARDEPPPDRVDRGVGNIEGHGSLEDLEIEKRYILRSLALS
jgi:hypothetical protein